MNLHFKYKHSVYIWITIMAFTQTCVGCYESAGSIFTDKIEFVSTT